jgi:hypothetical protein
MLAFAPANRGQSLLDWAGHLMTARAMLAAVELLLPSLGTGYDWEALLADAAARMQAQRGAERES